MASLLEDLIKKVHLLEAEEMIRRYFVMNGFDGILTVLGILIGSYISGNLNPKLIINVTLASGVAMFVSGFFGAYIAERAERLKEIKELERALLKDLSNSVYKDAVNAVTIIVGIVDGTSPLVVSLLTILPFFLGLEPLFAFCISIGIAIIQLFIMGAYLGRISKERAFFGGIRMVAIGILSMLLMLLLGSLPP